MGLGTLFINHISVDEAVSRHCIITGLNEANASQMT